MTIWKRSKPAADISPITFDDIVFLDETRAGRITLAISRHTMLGMGHAMLTFRLKRFPVRRTPLTVTLGQICGLSEPILRLAGVYLLLNIELRREAALEFPNRRLAIVRRLRALQE